MQLSSTLYYLGVLVCFLCTRFEQNSTAALDLIVAKTKLEVGARSIPMRRHQYFALFVCFSVPCFLVWLVYLFDLIISTANEVTIVRK